MFGNEQILDAGGAFGFSSASITGSNGAGQWPSGQTGGCQEKQRLPTAKW